MTQQISNEVSGGELLNTVKFAGSVSSAGVVTTVGANEEFEMLDNDGAAVWVNSLSIRSTGGAFTVKLNDETNTHSVSAGGSLNLDGLEISSFTVVDSGATFVYSGLFTRRVQV